MAVLTIDLAEEPVGGILARERHADRTFSGWFELVGFLEDAVRIARQANVDTPQRNQIRQQQALDGRQRTELTAT